MKCIRTLNLKVLAMATLTIVSSCHKDQTIVNSPNLELTDHYLIKNWYSLGLELGPKCNGFSEPIMARSLSYFSILMHESLFRGIPGMKSYKSTSDGFNFNLLQPDQSFEYNWAIVANDAAMAYFEIVFGSSGEMNRVKSVRDNNFNKYSIGLDSNVITKSSLYGKQLAHSLLKFAESDGQSAAYLNPNPSSYIPVKGEGKWIPSSPDYSPRPLLPYWGSTRAIIQNNIDQILLNKELIYSNLLNSNMYAEAVEVQNNSLAITVEQSEDAAYFNREMGATAQPLYHNFLLAIQLMTEKQLDLPKSLELLCKLSFGMNDGYVATYKYVYSKNLLRVSTYIKQNLNRYYQPIYPSLTIPEGVSDLAVSYSIGAEILSNFFGYRQVFIDRTQIERPDLRNKSKQFDSFQQMSIEASQVDIYTGVHFRTSIEAGRKLGTDIARNIINQIQK